MQEVYGCLSPTGCMSQCFPFLRVESTLTLDVLHHPGTIRRARLLSVEASPHFHDDFHPSANTVIEMAVFTAPSLSCQRLQALQYRPTFGCVNTDGFTAPHRLATETGSNTPMSFYQPTGKHIRLALRSSASASRRAFSPSSSELRRDL